MDYKARYEAMKKLNPKLTVQEFCTLMGITVEEFNDFSAKSIFGGIFGDIFK